MGSGRRRLSSRQRWFRSVPGQWALHSGNPLRCFWLPVLALNVSGGMTRFPAAIGGIPENVCSSRAFIRLTRNRPALPRLGVPVIAWFEERTLLLLLLRVARGLCSVLCALPP